MPNDLLTLIAKRDFTTVASGGSVVHCLLKPMSSELKTAQALILKIRRKDMRELYEQDLEQIRLEMKAQRRVMKPKNFGYRCTPLGVLAARP